MGSVLNIYDISPFIYAGAFYYTNSLDCETIQLPDGSWSSGSVGVGGIAYLFKFLYATRYEECIMCVDSPPDIKKEMFPGYKENRAGRDTTAARLQRDIADLILRDCEYQTLRYNGYEADDIIYSLWLKYRDQYDKIRIFCKDSDYFCMVDDKTEIHWVSSEGRIINKSNFATQCKSKEITVYNMVTPGKVLEGDVSDNIPAFPDYNLRMKISNALKRHPFCPMFGEKEIFEMALDELVTGELRERLQAQVDLVYPLFIDAEIETHCKPQNVNRFIQWGRAMNCPNFGPYSDHAVREKMVDIFEEVGISAPNHS